MSAPADPEEPTVIVIDDAADVREALDGLFRSVGLRVDVYASVAAFHEQPRRDRAGCFVLDVRLPGRSGLEFQQDLLASQDRRPIIFISGHADVAMCARAMKAGAAEFLTKPVRDQELLDAVHAAILRDVGRRREDQERARGQAGMALLTPREHEVMQHVAAGRRNKEIAADMNVSEGTVKLHRAQIMQKLQTRNLADLIRLADATGDKG